MLDPEGWNYADFSQAREYSYNRLFTPNLEIVLDTYGSNEAVFRWHIEGLAIRMLNCGVECPVVSRITGIESPDGLLANEVNYVKKPAELRKLEKKQPVAYNAVISYLAEKIAIKMIKEKLDVDLIIDITCWSRDKIFFYQRIVINEPVKEEDSEQ